MDGTSMIYNNDSPGRMVMGLARSRSRYASLFETKFMFVFAGITLNLNGIVS